MALTKITGDNIQPGSITTVALAEGAGGGPKISNVSIANSSYTILDDTAIALEGGYLVITGTGFASGCQVVINSNNATSVTFVDSNTIRAQVGAADAGTKTVYVVNTDGGTAIRVNGLTYSSTPTWVTGSTLTEASVDEAISIQLDASLATSYQLQAGSSLPAGLSLAANGLLTGTVTGIEDETTYNFIVEAIDAENQESPRSFSITITFGDEYFYATTLLLNGDGTNGANNNTFVDSSTNNFAITRNGNVTQGSFSPFSKPDGRWGTYYDGSSYTRYTGLTAIGTNDYTIELFFFVPENITAGGFGVMFDSNTVDLAGDGAMLIYNSGNINFRFIGNSGPVVSTSCSVGVWHHVAFSKSGTGTNNVSCYLNGVRVGQMTYTTSLVSTVANLGVFANLNNYYYKGYVSNVRIINGTALYSGTTLTVPTLPLTAVSGTVLLTERSNRFVNASNVSAATGGSPKVTPFSPFPITTAYDPAVNGGSGYFDGTGDYLSATLTSQAPGTGDFTYEFWYYPTSSSFNGTSFNTRSTPNSGSDGFDLNISSTSVSCTYTNVVWFNASTTAIKAFAWNHIAVVRNSSTVTVYVNGTSVGTASQSSNFTSTTFQFFVNVSGGTALSGYGANFKYSRSAVYTSAFTPPTAPPSATGSSLCLLMQNAGIQDLTGHNVLETVGNAQISTSVKKYGTGSMYFDGDGDWLVVPISENVAFGTGPYTVECWFYHSGALKTYSTMYSVVNGLKLTVMSDGAVGVWNSSATYVFSATGLVQSDQWYHIAFVRESTSLAKIYLNGNAVITVTSGAIVTTNFSTPQISYVGYFGDGFVHVFPGYIDDLRITKGVARYTSNFTPPDSAHRLR